MKVGDRPNLILGLGTNAVVAAIALGAIILHVHNPPLLRHVIREDGPIENATAICYFMAAGLFLLVAGRTAPRHWCAVGFALMLFVVAGEEISWGQRVFGIATPQALDHVNVQHEMNLHNIDGVHTNVRMVGVLVQTMICVVIPLAWRRHIGLRRRLEQWRMPIAPQWLAPALAIAVALMAYPRYVLGRVNQPMDETGELLISLMMLAFALHEASRISRGEMEAQRQFAYPRA